MKKLAPIVGALALAVSMTPTAVFADPAPKECKGSGVPHCYSQGFGWGDFDAAGVDIWTDFLHVDTYTTDFVTGEMWVMNEDPQFSWVETGFCRGGIAGGDPSNDFRYFWAEYSGPAGVTSFYSHSYGSANTNTWVNFAWYKQADNTWNLYKNGAYIGTTVMKTMPVGKELQVGTETTTKDASAHIRTRNAQFHQIASGAWQHSNYNYPVGAAYGVWTNVHSGDALEVWSLRQFRTSVVAPPSQTQPTTPPVTALGKEPIGPKLELMSASDKSAPDDDWIVKAAKEWAAANGEEHPKIELVHGVGRNDAVKHIARGNSYLPNNDSVVVKLKGKFNGDLIPHPENAPPVTGTVASLTFDAKTGEMTDNSMAEDKGDFDLGKLGNGQLKKFE